MRLYLDISNVFANFEAWIGGSCKPSDKGKLTTFPRFNDCQHKLKNVSNMLSYEELPEINSPRWLSLKDLDGEEWKDIDEAKGAFMISNYGRVKALARIRQNHYSTKIWEEKIRKIGYTVKGYPMISLTVNSKRVYTGSIHRLVARAFIPNLDNKQQIDHINTIITDNRVCNLRWVTALENAHNVLTEKNVKEVRSKQLGQKRPENVREKISNGKLGSKNPMYGKRGVLSHRSKPIIQLTMDGEFVKEWESAREAGKIYGMHLTACARGKRNMCGGYKWVYKENYKT